MALATTMMMMMTKGLRSKESDCDSHALVDRMLGSNETWKSASGIVMRFQSLSLSSWSKYVTLSAESSSTNGDAMTAQYARPRVVRNPENLEDSFRNIYSGFVNGIQIPTEGVQQARLTRRIEQWKQRCYKSNQE
jgi:hypothetical protein